MLVLMRHTGILTTISALLPYLLLVGFVVSIFLCVLFYEKKWNKMSRAVGADEFSTTKVIDSDKKFTASLTVVSLLFFLIALHGGLKLVSELSKLRESILLSIQKNQPTKHP